MALLTIKSYPIMIYQSKISAALKFPERTIRFDKSGRSKRSCSQNSMPIVASWLPPPIISPFCNLQAHRSSAGLQKFFRKQSPPNQAHLGTRINQYIRNYLCLSTPYSHFQVQSPFVAMWSMNTSHGMQL